MWRTLYGQLVTTGQGATPAPVAPDLARLSAALSAAGITPAKPLAIIESGAVKRTQTAAVSIAVHMPKDTRIPATVWELIETGAYRNGDWYVVQLKSA